MILTIVSTKGGATKTTLTANLGAYLADTGSKTLLVDADAQPGLSSYYPIGKKAENGLTHLITKVDVSNVISTVDIEGIKNLDLIYSDDPNGMLHNFILHCADGPMRLRYTLNKLRDSYDYILIDTIGTSGPLLTAAIFASDALISPLPVDTSSAREFNRGTTRAVNKVKEQALRMGVQIGDIHAVISRVDRSTDAQAILKEIQNRYASDDSVKLFKTIIPSKIAYKASTTHRKPVHLYDNKRTGKYPCANEIIRDIVEEIKNIKVKGRV